MMKGLIPILAALASIASAAPTVIAGLKNSNGFTIVEYLAKFDDANANLINGVPIRGLTPLGPYENLYYDHMGVVSDNVITAGLKPQSAPNLLGFDAIASARGLPQIVSEYDDSITDHFCLKSFYFGCVTNTQLGVVALPAGCSVTLTAYRNNVQVATQTATFAPPSGLVADMQKITLSKGFGNIDKVTFETVGTVQSTTLGALFDNLDYVVYFKK